MSWVENSAGSVSTNFSCLLSVLMLEISDDENRKPKTNETWILQKKYFLNRILLEKSMPTQMLIEAHEVIPFPVQQK